MYRKATHMDIPDVCHTNVEKPSTDQLVIAWRYQNLPASDMAPHGVNKKSLSNDFDMTSNLDLAEFASIPTLTSCEFRVDSFSSLEENLLKVLEHVEKIVRSEKPSVHRIGKFFIDSIASPLWGRRPRNLQACLANFMVRLRLLLRHSFHVVYITVSKLALQESGVESRWLSYSDYAFKVTGFDGLEASGNVTANPLYGEYNGLLRVLKLPSVSGMHLEPIARPLTLDWAFKVRRKQFILKYLDLPPCLSETVSRSNVAAPHSHCASAANGGGKEMVPDDVVNDGGQFYNTGGYWMISSRPMNGVFPINRIVDIAFDVYEELVWCVTATGQLTSFYGGTLEQYTTVPVIPVGSTVTDGSPQECELKSVLPSPRYTERIVYILARNAIFAYSKFCRPVGYSTTEKMQALECMVACRGTPCATSPSDSADFDRFFCGGLQPEVFELDAVSGANWGSLIRTIHVGNEGAVSLKPFAFGLCAANTTGQVKIIDPRAMQGVVRSFEAHSGEISDMSILYDGFTLITCGWSRKLNGSLRIDRLVNVYDLRFGRYQAPLSTVVDPSFLATVGPTQRIMVASQSGAFQTLEFEAPNLDPESLGNIMLDCYDRIVSFCVSSNGQCLLFGTEGGNIHLYSTSLDSCRFNHASMQTEFASPYADGLVPATLDSLSPEDYHHPVTSHHALSGMAGKKLIRIANAAVDATVAKETGYSFMRRAPLSSNYLERKRLFAFNHALSTAYQPIMDFDDTSAFTLSSVPFMLDPPVCNTAELAEWVCEGTGSRRDGLTSDWPSDLCGEPNRPMRPVDPELLAKANNTGVVQKPPDMGPVWCPYDPTPVPTSDLELGARRKKQLSYVQKMCQDASP
ncbi:Elongator complex protein 4 [Echinococcus granulosus]|uniref:Elongator complex protein 4 n=2 Tax=Echinococcus granulosus TaxID=6210 RepID=W6UTY6_ECHGR|nr:Elongator complex protein 4 [Echinococcus granulosus]EUB61837.1 Elongator complex protein 4 [Echinococcus granulosus]